MSQAPVVKVEKVIALRTLKENQLVAPGQMRTLVGELMPILEKTVPGHLKKVVERVGSSLVNEMNRNPVLQQCTAMSLLGGLLQTAQLGLELGGVLGQAYLVPYYNNNLKAQEAQFQIGYKGLIALAARSGKTKAFDSHPVNANDEFDYGLGTKPFVHHKPPKAGDRGEMIGVYAYLHTSDDGVMVEYMSIDEINAHRAKYSKQKGDRSPWNTAFPEMARKTPLRRLAKRTPISVEIVHASSLDEWDEEGIEQGLRSLTRTAIDRGDLPPTPSHRAAEVAAAIGADINPDAEDPPAGE